jgi:hypothetical protein
MFVMLKHLLLASLPLAFGVAAGWGFAYLQGSCGSLVGPVFAAKCHGRQLEYQILFQTGGTALGVLLGATLGARLELRRRRTVQQAPTTGEPS